MRFTYDEPEIQRELDEARTADALEAALHKLMGLPAKFRDADIYGRRLFAQGLDALIPTLARRLRLQDLPRPKSNENVCILASQFYSTGGHTRVAIDMIERLQPAGAVTLLTNIFGGLRSSGLLAGAGGNRTFMNERACLIASSAKHVDRILEVYMILAALRPSRIILMNHPMDIVATTAAWPFRDVVEFIHHSDHMPGLGATLPFSAHVDVTYTCHLACREAGLNPIYAGMAGPRSDVVAPPSEGPGLRLATCGSIHKYKGRGRYKWTDFAVAALRQPGAELIHIGPTEEPFRNEVRQALKAAAISPNRYVFADFQPSLPAELEKRKVDVYLSSYPETGGKANLEAMMAGVPVIVPIDRDLPPLLEYRLPLPRWLPVGGPGELQAVMAKAKALRDELDSPEHVAALAREMSRFDDYVALRPVMPTPADDCIPA